MMRLVRELNGVTLDLAVAKALGAAIINRPPLDAMQLKGTAWLSRDGVVVVWAVGGLFGRFTPHADWSIAGDIIDRNRINVLFRSGLNHPAHDTGPDYWWACTDIARRGTSAPTPLVAAMRTFVMGKFGDEVDLP
ncbi:MAG: phage protein NinX family protein [Burkholderiales bacterium]